MTIWNSLWGANHYVLLPWCLLFPHKQWIMSAPRKWRLFPLFLKAFIFPFSSFIYFLYLLQNVSTIKIKAFKENTKKKKYKLIFSEAGLVTEFRLAKKQTWHKANKTTNFFFKFSQAEVKFQVIHLLRPLPEIITLLAYSISPVN